MDIWEAFYIGSGDSKADLGIVDDAISSKLNDVNDIVEHHHQFAWNIKLISSLPKSRDKLNQLLKAKLEGENKNNFPNWFIASISGWLDEDARTKLLEEWLADDKDDTLDLPWLLRHAETNNGLYVKIFGKLVRTYKKNKSEERIKQITKLFSQLDVQYLDEASEMLGKETPAVAACLLSRSDISEDYMIKGLKALSKLSKQRSIAIELDFEMLGKLGPKARLDAMKQLLGLFSRWYNNKATTLPFKEIPTKEEVANFLFPCSIKYNSEVTDVLQKFEEMTKPQPKPPVAKSYGLRR